MWTFPLRYYNSGIMVCVCIYEISYINILTDMVADKLFSLSAGCVTAANLATLLIKLRDYRKISTSYEYIRHISP